MDLSTLLAPMLLGTLLGTLSRYAAWEFSWGCSLLSWNALFVMLFVLLWHTI
jgi:hypothetical protein